MHPLSLSIVAIAWSLVSALQVDARHGDPHHKRQLRTAPRLFPKVVTEEAAVKEQPEALKPDEAPPPEAESLHKQAAATITRIGKVERVKHRILTFFNDMTMFRTIFFRDFTPPEQLLRLGFAQASIAVIWFLIFYKFFYRNDRSNMAGRDVLDGDPDIALIFHDPKHDHRDKNVRLTPDQWATLQQWPIMNKTEGVTSAREYRLARHLSQTSFAHIKPEHCPTRDEVRKDCLKEACDYFINKGFDLGVRRSVDKDELFVCVSLRNEPWTQHYLAKHHVRVQLSRKIFGDSALDMGVDQDDPASSPPYMAFHTSLALRFHQITHSNAWESGGLEHASGRDRILRDMFHMPGGMLSSMARTRMIYKDIVDDFPFNIAKNYDVMVDWFPCHSQARIHQLQGPLKWARWRALLDMSFKQPIQALFDYFGARVTFTFVWNGVYCKWLLALTPVALAIEAMKYFGFSEERDVLAMSIIIVIWARVASNLWERERGYYTEDKELQNEESLPCSSFSGTLKSSKVDSNINVVAYSGKKRTAWKVFSGTVIITFCFFVAACSHWWVSKWAAYPENRCYSFGLAIQMMIFDFVVRHLIKWLVRFENHEFRGERFNSLLWKHFCFGFINHYYSFFYIVLCLKQSEAGCPAGGCLAFLREQLAYVLVALSAMRIVKNLAGTARVQLSLWHETYSMQEKLSPRGTSVKQHSFLESQGKFVKYGTEDEIQDMRELVLSLGFVLVFGNVVPIVVVVCLVEFVVRLRSQAVFLTTSARRPLSAVIRGIGNWRGVIEFLTIVGTALNCVILVSEGHTFEKAEFSVKIAAFVLCMMLAYMLIKTVDLVVPVVDAETKLMLKRRERVMTLIRGSEDLKTIPEKKPEKVNTIRKYVDDPNENPHPRDHPGILDEQGFGALHFNTISSPRDQGQDGGSRGSPMSARFS